MGKSIPPGRMKFNPLCQGPDRGRPPKWGIAIFPRNVYNRRISFFHRDFFKRFI